MSRVMDLMSIIGLGKIQEAKKKVPWWHYFERVPIKGGQIPYDWVDYDIGRRCSFIDKKREHTTRKQIVCQCGRKVRKPKPGVTKCYECRFTKDKRKARFEKLKADGKCTTCWQVKPENGKLTCDDCLEKKRILNHAVKGLNCDE